MTAATFIRLLAARDKPTALRAAVRGGSGVNFNDMYSVDPASFRALPGSAFAYWVTEAVRNLFRALSPLEGPGRTARQGLATTDDPRFVRAWWEVSLPGTGYWWPFVKGGGNSPFYRDLYLLVNWHRGGEEVKANIVHRYLYLNGNAGFVAKNTAFYFRPGLTWPARPYLRGSFAVVPPGAVFSHTGTMIFSESPSAVSTLACLLNSTAFIGLLHLLMARGGPGSDRTLKYEVGYVSSVPVPELTAAASTRFGEELTPRAWSVKRSLDTRTETSHAFVLPALLQVEAATLADRAAAWAARVRAADDELAAIQAEIDERCFALYGIGEEDRRAITEGFGGGSAEAAEASADDADAANEEEEAEDAADTATLATELVSWAAGVAFGRFDVRLATGERELPGEPEPFDPLPACSPGMLTGADGLPLAAPPAGYPVTFPGDGVLVDDEGHPRDLIAAIRSVFGIVFGSDADARWQEAAALLDPRGHDLRAWLRSAFFEQHLRRHSKSRRKAPILWQLGVSSGRYAAWCYAHRLTADTLFAVSRDLVAPKLALEERRRTALAQDAGPNPTAKQRAELAAQDDIVEELRAFADEVRRVAPLWDPDLDDGVVLASAPLWRLVPHKAWQKELKGRWDELAKGKYDWAHLAMRLWPERVVPKCADDRSLAIAHGLEDVFWAEGADGKWSKRTRPRTPIDALVAERTSPAVKAALADLLAAPVPAAARGRGRARE